MKKRYFVAIALFVSFANAYANPVTAVLPSGAKVTMVPFQTGFLKSLGNQSVIVDFPRSGEESLTKIEFSVQMERDMYSSRPPVPKCLNVSISGPGAQLKQLEYELTTLEERHPYDAKTIDRYSTNEAWNFCMKLNGYRNENENRKIFDWLANLPTHSIDVKEILHSLLDQEGSIAIRGKYFSAAIVAEILPQIREDVSDQYTRYKEAGLEKKIEKYKQKFQASNDANTVAEIDYEIAQLLLDSKTVTQFPVRNRNVALKLLANIPRSSSKFAQANSILADNLLADFDGQDVESRKEAVINVIHAVCNAKDQADSRIFGQVMSTVLRGYPCGTLGGEAHPLIAKSPAETLINVSTSIAKTSSDIQALEQERAALIAKRSGANAAK